LYKKLKRLKEKDFRKIEELRVVTKKMNKKKLEMKERIFTEVPKTQLRALQNTQMEKQV
jgi:hypothetical protein